jgi:hypothetical protein
MRIAVAGAVIAAALAGCGMVPDGPEIVGVQEPAPANYREIVSEHVRRTYYHPFSIRDASISAPAVGAIYRHGTLGVHEYGWLVCLRANAKSRAGRDTGITETTMILRHGAVVASLSGPDWQGYNRNMCKGAQYEPFALEDSTRSAVLR